MARTVRSRREAYDNIAVGSAITTRERTISGALPPSFNYGAKDNISVGNSNAAERIIVKTTALLTGERLG